MKQNLRNLPLLLAAAALSVASTAGCGDAPRPVERERQSATSPSSPHGGMPAMTASGAGAHPPFFTGSVRIVGELADVREGVVFVSAKPEGVRMPFLSRKYMMGEEASFEQIDGGRLLRFELTEENFLGGGIPEGGIILEARYDPDGYVDTRDGQLAVTVSATPGQSDVELVLGEG